MALFDSQRTCTAAAGEPPPSHTLYIVIKQFRTSVGEGSGRLSLSFVTAPAHTIKGQSSLADALQLRLFARRPTVYFII